MQKALLIGTPQITNKLGKTRVTASIEFDNKKFSIWYQSKYISSQTTNLVDAYLVACLFLAMSKGVDIYVDDVVSPKLLEKIPQIQDIFVKWYPELHKTTIHSALNSSEYTRPKTNYQTLSLFSGGVDSFFTLLKNEKDIDGLINVHGFDIKLSEESFYKKLQKNLGNIYGHYKKKPLWVKTNLRDLSDLYCNWGEIYHGAALVSVALLVSERYNRLLIPSTHSYADLFPWGSHTLIDHLWSTEYIEFVHDGAEATRFEKLEYITQSQFVLDNLTVCWQRIHLKEGERNCSKCEKCIRTMIALKILGKLNSSSSFEHSLPTDSVKKIIIRNESDLAFLLENLDAAKKHSNDAELTEAINVAISEFQNHQLYDHLLNNPGFFASDYFIPLKHYAANALWQHATKYMIKTAPKEIIKKMRNKTKEL